MFKRFLRIYRSSSFYRHWVYGLISLLLTLNFSVSNIKPSYAISWIELMIRGIQVVQISNLSDHQEMALGQEINQQILDSGETKIYDNKLINNYINQIGQKLAKTSTRPNLSYTFQVMDDNNINAFATMGGYVYINKGLILAADNEAELASVIAHEIGHIVGHHSIEQMRQQAIAQGLLSAAGLDRSNAIQIGVELAVNRPHSRLDEFEADSIGLENLKRANYAPAGMLGFMNKLLEQSSSIPSFLSTHPATSSRIRELEAKIDPLTMNVGDGLDRKAYKNRISSM